METGDWRLICLQSLGLGNGRFPIIFHAGTIKIVVCCW